jgi:general stress protein 26
MSDDAERIWNLMEKFPVCTLTAWNGSELRSRPMAAFVRRRNDAIFFLADSSYFTDQAIRAHPGVSLTFADSASQQIVSVAGTAQMSADPSVIRELWATPANALWDSADNPSIRMLRITPLRAELRDGPGRTVKAVSMTNPAPGSAAAAAKVPR